MRSEIATEPQCAPAVLMIRPVRFHANPQTRASNAFQQRNLALDDAAQQALALAEFEGLVNALEEAGVATYVFDDTREPNTPDSIFPNNWVSFHPDGQVVLYPMMAENRRTERRLDVIERLGAEIGFQVGALVDLSPLEAEGRFLEGTGSLVLDRSSRVAYACLSPRTDADALGEFGRRLGYDVEAFDAVGVDGTPIYHTNVMMNVGDGVAVVCLEAISDAARRVAVVERLQATGHEVVAISLAQMGCFAGNMLALRARDGRQVLAMSARAEACLGAEQRAVLERHAAIVSAPIPTIEDSAGGSVRCMLAEIFLPRS